MASDNWKRVEELLEAAQKFAGEQRAESLGKACPDDAQLRGEVESLLQAADSGHSLLDGSPLSSIAEQVNCGVVRRALVQCETQKLP